MFQVTGAPGSGVTTVGRLLAMRLGCGILDLDDIHWLSTDPPYVEVRSDTEKMTIVRSFLHSNHSRVVISGSLVGWGDELAKFLSGCLYLLCPTATRIDRIREREKKRFASAIEEGGCMHERHMAFMQWAFLYDMRRMVDDVRSQEGDLLWLTKLSCPTFLLSSDELSAMQCAEMTFAYLQAHSCVLGHEFSPRS